MKPPLTEGMHVSDYYYIILSSTACHRPTIQLKVKTLNLWMKPYLHYYYASIALDTLYG